MTVLSSSSAWMKIRCGFQAGRKERRKANLDHWWLQVLIGESLLLIIHIEGVAAACLCGIIPFISLLCILLFVLIPQYIYLYKDTKDIAARFNLVAEPAKVGVALDLVCRCWKPEWFKCLNVQKIFGTHQCNSSKTNWTLKILAWAFDASMLSALERCSSSCSDLKSSPSGDNCQCSKLFYAKPICLQLF